MERRLIKPISIFCICFLILSLSSCKTSKPDPDDVLLQSETVTTTTTTFLQTRSPEETSATNVNKKYEVEKEIYANVYDQYDGPFTWEGAGIKFDVPEGLVLSINNNMPYLSTPDIKENLYEPTANYEFSPCFLQNREYNSINEFTDEEFKKYIDSMQYYLTARYKGLNMKNAAYEAKDGYKCCSLSGDRNGSKYLVQYYVIDNGTLISFYVKVDSDYYKTYTDDITSIIKSFSYSNINYIP